jgi:hypothetical protein
VSEAPPYCCPVDPGEIKADPAIQIAELAANPEVMGTDPTRVKEVRLNPPDPDQITSGPTCVIVTTNAPLAPVAPVDPA